MNLRIQSSMPFLLDPGRLGRKQSGGRPVRPHHAAWLAAHPDRTLRWFRRMLREGFDVHHLNGDHDDNEPGNLVLVEHEDHMRLHGIAGALRKISPAQCARAIAVRASQGSRRRAVTADGADAYRMAMAGESWMGIATKLGSSRGMVHAAARSHAIRSDLQWPVGRVRQLLHEKPVT